MALRSCAWFDSSANIDVTALHLKRYPNFGSNPETQRSNKPIIDIAQAGRDLSPGNLHPLVPVEQMREADGSVLTFPRHQRVASRALSRRRGSRTMVYARGQAEIVKAQCLNSRIRFDDVPALVLVLTCDDARMCAGHIYRVDAGLR